MSELGKAVAAKDRKKALLDAVDSLVHAVRERVEMKMELDRRANEVLDARAKLVKLLEP